MLHIIVKLIRFQELETSVMSGSTLKSPVIKIESYSLEKTMASAKLSRKSLFWMSVYTKEKILGFFFRFS